MIEALSSDSDDANGEGSFDLSAIEESLEKIAEDVEAAAVEGSDEESDEEEEEKNLVEEPNSARKQSAYLGGYVFCLVLYIMRHVI